MYIAIDLALSEQSPKTIFLAKKEVKESNVIKVTRNEIKPCNNSEMKLYIARLDYLVENQDDKEKEEEEVEPKK
jgi:hypothetical protein